MEEKNYKTTKLQAGSYNIVRSYVAVDTTIAVLKAFKSTGGGQTVKKVSAATAVEQTFNPFTADPVKALHFAMLV